VNAHAGQTIYFPGSPSSTPYWLNATLTRPSLTTFIGPGAFGSPFKAANASNLQAVVADAYWFTTTGNPVYGGAYIDMAIDGNAANQSTYTITDNPNGGHGLVTCQGRVAIQGCFVQNNPVDGILLSLHRSNGSSLPWGPIESRIERNWAVSNGRDGIHVEAGYTGVGSSDGYCQNNIPYSNGRWNINLESSIGYWVKDNHPYHFWGNGIGGINVQSFGVTEVSGNEVDHFGGGNFGPTPSGGFPTFVATLNSGASTITITDGVNTFTSADIGSIVTGTGLYSASNGIAYIQSITSSTVAVVACGAGNAVTSSGTGITVTRKSPTLHITPGNIAISGNTVTAATGTFSCLDVGANIDTGGTATTITAVASSSSITVANGSVLSATTANIRPVYKGLVVGTNSYNLTGAVLNNVIWHSYFSNGPMTWFEFDLTDASGTPNNAFTIQISGNRALENSASVGGSNSGKVAYSINSVSPAGTGTVNIYGIGNIYRNSSTDTFGTVVQTFGTVNSVDDPTFITTGTSGLSNYYLSQATFNAAKQPTPPVLVQNAIATLFTIASGASTTFNVGTGGSGTNVGSTPAVGDVLVLEVAQSGGAVSSACSFTATTNGSAWTLVGTPQTYGSGTVLTRTVTSADISSGTYLPITITPTNQGGVAVNSVQALVSEWSNVNTTAGTNGVFLQGWVANSGAVSTVSNTSIRLANATTDGVLVMGKQTTIATGNAGAATIQATLNAGGTLIAAKTAPSASVQPSYGAAIWSFTNAPSSWTGIATLQFNDWTNTSYTTAQSVYPTYAVISVRGLSALSDPTKLPLSGGTMSGAIAMGSNKITGLAAGTNPSDAVRFDQLLSGPNVIGPAQVGLVAWSFDLALANSAVSGPTVGTVDLTQFYMASSATVNNIMFRCSSTGASSITSCYFGIYNQSGTLLGSTANVTTINASTTYYIPFTSSISLTPGQYYIAYLINALIAPTFTGWTGNSLVNPTFSTSAGTLAGNGRHLSYGSGFTTLPTIAGSGTTPTGVSNLYAFGLY